MKELITVFTPTYNRANYLVRPFQSLIRQTNKDFVWLIIDDGSTDNTKEIIDSFRIKADFKIMYYYKENGGRHTALNYSYEILQTEFVINLDSDDELLPTCIEDLYDIIKQNDLINKKNIWQIVGLCQNQDSILVGRKIDEKINMLSGRKQRKYAQKYRFEKSCCRRVEILKQFRFPVYNDTKFVTENTLWEKISLSYDSFFVNKIFRVYFDSTEGSIINSKSKTDFSRMKSRYYYSSFCLKELYEDRWINKNYFISLFNIARSGICCRIKTKEVISNAKKLPWKLFILFISYPIAYLYVIIKKERKKDH